jgi:predicted transcriptional regulator
MEVYLRAVDSRTTTADLGHVLKVVNGYQQTCLVAAAVELALFDEIAAGAETIDDLASRLRVDRSALARLIRALAAIGFVTQAEERVSLTGCGSALVDGGIASSIRSWTFLVGGEYLQLWGNLARSVRTGAPVFESVFACSPWKHREDHPALNDAFNRVTSAEQTRAIAALLRAVDLAECRCVMDVGGGHGNLLAGALTKHPGLGGILFDLPHVVAGAEASLRKIGVAERCRVIGGSFLERIPAGADVQILKHVLHNWDDERCGTILRNARAAIENDGKLLILENVVPADDVGAALPIVMLDIHMLVVHGGRERTLAEYKALLESAGFRLGRYMATRAGAPDIIEALVQ